MPSIGWNSIDRAVPCNKKIAAIHNKELRPIRKEDLACTASALATPAFLEFVFCLTLLVAIEQLDWLAETVSRYQVVFIHEAMATPLGA